MTRAADLEDLHRLQKMALTAAQGRVAEVARREAAIETQVAYLQAQRRQPLVGDFGQALRWRAWTRLTTRHWRRRSSLLHTVPRAL